MKSLATLIYTLLIVHCTVVVSHAQYTIDDLNTVLSALKGEQDVAEVRTYDSLKKACRSGLVKCKKGKVIGLDFQFANLNGYIHPDIIKLTDLEYVNFEYNYLAGAIPEGLSQLKNIEELLFNGNFLTGPLPDDLHDMKSKVVVDLSQNSIKDVDKRSIKKFNIKNQFNLEGCRSPDSIFIDMQDLFSELKDKPLDAVTPNKDTMVGTEEMPRFPGCEEKELTDDELKNCSQNEMLQFIYKNLRYPTIARENGIEGMVVVQFVVLDTGEIGYAKVVRDIGGRCGNASLWIVNRMNYICDRWVPGIQRGQAVKVLYTLPIKFALQ